MHYCCLVITKEFPTDDVLAKVMAPYEEGKFYEAEERGEHPEYPIFEWDWYQVGGRYGGQFKLEIRADDPEYKWEFYSREPRENRLFRSGAFIRTKELMGNKPYGWSTYHEEEFFQYMGIREGFLRVDGGRIRDLLNFEDVGCFCFIDADGKPFARERWNGDKFEKDPCFDESLKKTIDESKDYYACIVDFHD